MTDEFSEAVQKQKELLAESYEKSKQYANIVTLAAYAGLFSLWGFTKDYLAPWQVFLAGLFILLSLIIYVVFELSSAWIRGMQIKRQLDALNDAEKIRQFSGAYARGEIERAQKFMAIWPYVFLSAAGAAAVGASILLLSFIGGLFCPA